MSIFDNLLTGTPGTQTQTSQLAPGAQGLATNLFEQTSAMASQPYTPYDGQRVAGLTDGQNNAIWNSNNIAARGGDLYTQLVEMMNRGMLPGMLPQAGALSGQMGDVAQGATGFLPGLSTAATNSGALAGLGQGIVPAGIDATLGLAQRFPNMNVDEYMNPYVENVIDPAIGDVERRVAQQRQELNSRAAKTGSFGGSRNAVAQQMLEGEGQREIGRLSADARAKAFNEAANQFRLDQSNIPKLYSDALGLAGKGQDLQSNAIRDTQGAIAGTGGVQQLLRGGIQGIGDVAALEQLRYNQQQQLLDANQGLVGTQVQPLLATGAMQQGNQQANLDKMYADFLEQRDWGKRGLDQLRQTLGLGSVATPTTSSTNMPAGPSTASQIIGGGTALVGALGGLGGATNAVSKAGNWLSGLWGGGGGGASPVEMTADGGGFLFKRGGLVGVGA